MDSSPVLLGLCLLGGVALMMCTGDPGSPMVEMDLLLPQSFVPFRHNGTRVGVSSVWSLRRVSLENHVAGTVTKNLPIASLNEWLAVAGVKADSDARQLTASLEKTVTAVVATSRVCTVLFFLACVCCCLHLVAAAPAPTTAMRKSRRRKIAALLKRFAAILATVGSAGIVVAAGAYGTEMYADVRAMLPAMVKRLEIICLTHGTSECRIAALPLWGAYCLAFTTGVTLLFSLAILTWDNAKPDHAPLALPLLLTENDLERMIAQRRLPA